MAPRLRGEPTGQGGEGEEIEEEEEEENKEALIVAHRGRATMRGAQSPDGKVPRGQIKEQLRYHYGQGLEFRFSL